MEVLCSIVDVVDVAHNVVKLLFTDVPSLKVL